MMMMMISMTKCFYFQSNCRCLFFVSKFFFRFTFEETKIAFTPSGDYFDIKSGRKQIHLDATSRQIWNTEIIWKEKLEDLLDILDTDQRSGQTMTNVAVHHDEGDIDDKMFLSVKGSSCMLMMITLFQWLLNSSSSASLNKRGESCFSS